MKQTNKPVTWLITVMRIMNRAQLGRLGLAKHKKCFSESKQQAAQKTKGALAQTLIKTRAQKMDMGRWQAPGSKRKLFLGVGRECCEVTSYLLGWRVGTAFG